MNNNCSNPLTLKFGSEYKVDKPGDQSGEYVDKQVADRLLSACEWALSQFKRLAYEGRYPDFMLANNGGSGLVPLVDAINQAKGRDATSDSIPSDTKQKRPALFSEWMHAAVKRTGRANTGEYSTWLEIQLLQAREQLELLSQARELEGYSISFDTKRMTPYNQNDELPDLYTVLFVTVEEVNGVTFRMPHIGIHSFNEQKFISNGTKYKETVECYSMYTLYPQK